MYSIVIIKYIFLIHSYCMASNVAVSFIKSLLDYGVILVLDSPLFNIILSWLCNIFFLFCHSDIFKAIYVEQNAISIRFLSHIFSVHSLKSICLNQFSSHRFSLCANYDRCSNRNWLCCLDIWVPKHAINM